ncbi:hypothetical protein SEMRO_2485_G328980.1 [Seminavis robusta]|uniref:Uncharacterized protein n=1 Tax=Seminavis robusta TaxID=568900 RepID=A0A9N8HXG0_9STRA|nr:hypothetical protein SEMRO_2485_G328980.1 [Seminavis robusta]|eukprot:Sro2485_g328980.1 n/a (273) ;mRNA; f:2166-2984
MAKKKTKTSAKRPTVDGLTWAESQARALLKDDIISGRVTPAMKPKAVHESRQEFLKWELSLFRSNLYTLRDSIARDYHRMAKDVMLFGIDMAVLKERRDKDPPKSLPWHRSAAKQLLEKDIDDGIHLQILPNGKKIKPESIYKSRREYQEYELTVFRNHIYQEVKRREKRESNLRFEKKKLRVARPVIATDQAIDLVERGGVVNDGDERKRLAKKIEGEKLNEGIETLLRDQDNSTISTNSAISTNSHTSKASKTLARKREAAAKKKKKAIL